MRSSMSIQFFLLAVLCICSSIAQQKSSVVSIFENKAQICSGVLLSNKYVLSSSNCFASPDQDFGKLRVVLTEQNVLDSRDAGVYEIESSSEQYWNDLNTERIAHRSIHVGLAILRLAHKTPFHADVHKACLYQKEQTPELKTKNAFVMQVLAKTYRAQVKTNYPFEPITQSWFDAPKYTSVQELTEQAKQFAPICKSSSILCAQIDTKEYLEKRVCSAEIGAPLVKREADRDLVAGLLSYVQNKSKANPILRTLQVEEQTCPMHFIFVKPTENFDLIKNLVKDDLCVV